jgi:hypothetical protein
MLVTGRHCRNFHIIILSRGVIADRVSLLPPNSLLPSRRSLESMEFIRGAGKADEVC